MKKIPRLKKGSRIAILSPSWGGTKSFPHIYKKGLERLKTSFGLELIEFPTTKMTETEVYNSPSQRARDINEAFKRKDIEGIIVTIGGDDGIRVLKHLDLEIIKNNPKFFMGYSDTAIFNIYFNQLNFITFNGPSVMAGFAESKTLKEDFVKHIKTFLFSNWKKFEYSPFKEYTDKYLNWSEPKNLNKENINYVENSEGWNFIQGTGNVVGILTGGCMDALEIMKGTVYWPKKTYWKNKILFFETSEMKPSPEQIECILRNYGLQGILSNITGMLFGRPKNYSQEEKIELDKVLLKILKEFNRQDMIVVTNVDFGHTDPQIILPLGVKMEIDVDKKRLRLIESPFK